MNERVSHRTLSWCVSPVHALQSGWCDFFILISHNFVWVNHWFISPKNVVAIGYKSGIISRWIDTSEKSQVQKIIYEIKKTNVGVIIELWGTPFLLGNNVELNWLNEHLFSVIQKGCTQLMGRSWYSIPRQCLKKYAYCMINTIKRFLEIQKYH